MSSEFGEKVNSEYKEFLEEVMKKEGQEQRVHDFFEKRAALLPGILGIKASAHHGPFKEIVFSKFQLPGTFRRVPDFLFVSKSSSEVTVVMIELEDPTKEMFNQDNTISQKFNLAYQQLEDWAAWIEEGSNKALLTSILNNAYNTPFISQLPMKVEYILIYGREDEFKGNDIRTKRRSQKKKNNIDIISFDSIKCAYYPENLITVRMGQNGVIALQVDERYKYDYVMRSNHQQIHEKNDAVQRNIYKSEKDKQRVIESIIKLDKLSDEEALQCQINRGMEKKLKNAPYVRNESGGIKLYLKEDSIFKIKNKE